MTPMIMKDGMQLQVPRAKSAIGAKGTKHGTGRKKLLLSDDTTCDRTLDLRGKQHNFSRTDFRI